MAIHWPKMFKFWKKSLFWDQKFFYTNYTMHAPTTELIQRRKNLINEVRKYSFQNFNQNWGNLIVLPAAEIQYMAYHVPYPFHQDSHYFYFTGLNEPDSVLVFFIHSEQNESMYEIKLFVDIKDKNGEMWDGPSIGFLEASLLSGIQNIYPLGDLEKFVEHCVGSSKLTHLWYTPLSGSKFDQRPFNNRIFRKFLGFFDELRSKNIPIKNPDSFVDNLRVVKSNFEIEQIRIANQITVRALKSTVAISTPNISEYALFSHIDHEVRLSGSLLSYPPVIAGGQRTNIIHYLKSNKDIKDGDLVLIDVGCKVNGYTSDITRTWPINGRFTSYQSILYEILIDVQKSCAALASPDTNLHILHEHMLQELRRHLINERIIPNNTSIKTIQKICPHHVSHYIGLDVHDTPTIPYDRPLSPGTTFPLEPGLYFRKECATLGFIKEFLDLGIRLEDDFVILESGNAEILNDEFPKTVRELEKLIGSQTVKPNNFQRQPQV